MESSLDTVSNNSMGFGTGIDWNNTEIEKNATMLIRLLGLHEAGTLSPAVFNNIAKKYSSKLEGSLGLWKQYYNIQEREADIYGSELNRAMEQNATLTARQRIGDITVKEYELKQAMIQWDIENNKDKANIAKRTSTNSINYMIHWTTRPGNPSNKSHHHNRNRDRTRAIHNNNAELHPT